MAGRRCTICGITYVTAVLTCPGCGEKTWYGDFDDEPKADPTAKPPAPFTQDAPPSGRDPESWRFERYVALGFALDDCALLARAVDATGFAVYHGDVARALRAALETRDADDARAVVARCYA
jgi:hypothetical protein